MSISYERSVIEASAEIPNRALFKPAEVCEIAQLQPYVLRSWEAEFPDLGVARGGTAARMYRRADVERVLQIKHLLFVEGLTLAGIRRRIEDDASPVVAEDVPLDELLGRNARERLTAVKRGLQGILDLLSREDVTEPLPALRLAAAPEKATSKPDGRRTTLPPKTLARSRSARKTRPSRRKRH
jgi:DNA-binding transcriptional MerR regulator